MPMPDFFAFAPTLTVRDPLADFLGAAEEGVLTYSYTDAVRLAGHSCPTVAGVWLMACRGLAALYPEGLPERGGILVELPGRRDEGVTGVTASVFTLVTGATEDSGFRGLAGRFNRRNLLGFGRGVPGDVRLTRLATGAAVDVALDLGLVPADPEIGALMGACLMGEADEAMGADFRARWQGRVRALLERAADPALVRVAPAE